MTLFKKKFNPTDGKYLSGLDYFIDRTGPPLIAYKDALVYAQRVIEDEYYVWGFEGFHRGSDYLQPDMKCIAGGGELPFQYEEIESILTEDDYQRIDVIEFVISSNSKGKTKTFFIK